MEQKNIREWNGQVYTAQEGASIIKELDDRTKSEIEGLNSIAELGTLLKIISDRLIPMEAHGGSLVLRFSAQTSRTRIMSGDVVILPKGTPLFEGDFTIARANRDDPESEQHFDEPYLQSR